MDTPELSLTVVGSSSSIPRPGKACSSYLLRSGADAVLLDIGSGAYANLALHMSPSKVSAICISHFHADHFLDIVPYRYALRYGAPHPQGRLPLYVPPGGTEMLHTLALAVSSESPQFFEEVFDIREYRADMRIVVGELTVCPTAVRHFIPGFAMRVEAHGTSVTYSADSTFTPEVTVSARNADYFICEATLGPDGRESGDKGHSSARDAGRMATHAGVRALGLTHYGEHFQVEALRAAAAQEFAGPIDVLDDHMQKNIPHPARAASFDGPYPASGCEQHADRF